MAGVRNRAAAKLTALWADSDAASLAYNGDPKTASFFQRLDLPAAEVEKLLATRIEFSDIKSTTFHQVGTPYGVVSTPIEHKFPPDHIRSLEARAYKFIVSDHNLEPKQLADKLTKEFGIKDVKGFLTKVAAKSLQDELAALSSRSTEEAEKLADRDQFSRLRQLVNTNGTVKAGQGSKLIAWALGNKLQDITLATLEERKVKRAAALAAGSIVTPDDKELGLATEGGKVNEQSRYYQQYYQVAEAALIDNLSADN
jgi:hypothetical protein